jgi:phage RecT family recombinase
MANALTVYEHELNELRPTFRDVMPPGIDPDRLKRTVLISLDRTPKLLECTKSSVMQAAITLAILGLEADGATGQGFLIPFAGKAQTVIGYKGYNTLAARNGFGIRGHRVYEGDVFDLDLGRPLPIIHKPDIKTPIAQRKLLGCYALAISHTGLQIPQWLSIDELEAVRLKSPGAKKADSPWNDPLVGRLAMYEKTAKRRLQRVMPLSAYIAGASMEEAHEERGLHSWIDPKDGVSTEHTHRLTETQPAEEGALDNIDRPANPFIIDKGKEQVECPHEDDWQAKMLIAIESIAKHKDELSKKNLQRFRELNGPIMSNLYEKGFAKNVRAVDAAFTAALKD